MAGTELYSRTLIVIDLSAATTMDNHQFVRLFRAMLPTRPSARSWRTSVSHGHGLLTAASINARGPEPGETFARCRPTLLQADSLRWQTGRMRTPARHIVNLCVYLQALHERNVAFYKRHGFQITSKTASNRGEPPCWGMIRP
jgi:hypothetical protein